MQQVAYLFKKTIQNKVIQEFLVIQMHTALYTNTTDNSVNKQSAISIHTLEKVGTKRDTSLTNQKSQKQPKTNIETKKTRTKPNQTWHTQMRITSKEEVLWKGDDKTMEAMDHVRARGPHGGANKREAHGGTGGVETWGRAAGGEQGGQDQGNVTGSEDWGEASGTEDNGGAKGMEDHGDTMEQPH